MSTATQTGTLSIHSENIFPIIKKFLYSDEEVFLRELVSNAVDAIQKLKTLHGRGKFDADLGELQVDVLLDKEAKTLTIRDNGLGMTAEEIDKYINQIAFSSATDFLEQYKDDGAQIIGHFGLGFYSAFMVADKVEIRTKSYQSGTEGAHWSCTGDTSFTIEADPTKTQRGTDIILHISEAANEYLEPVRIREVLRKYGRFLPVPVKFDNEQVNNPNPAWVKPPAELTDDDYKNFYKELYPASSDPLFWIHLNVDYPFTLKGILYFPPVKGAVNLDKNKISLYQNQVFVTDNVEDVVPEYLALLHGVLDSPDIPLNVSRSYLQTDAAVRKISQHIAKKVAGRLSDLYKADRENYEKKWSDIGLFVKYGMMRDDTFYDRAKDIALVVNTEGEHFTFDEYQTKVADTQTDKDDRTVWLYTIDTEANDSQVAAAKARGYDVLLFADAFDLNFLQFLESKREKLDLKRLDAASLDKLIDKGLEKTSALNEAEEKELKDVFDTLIDNKLVNVRLEPGSEKEPPASIVREEHSRRMADMAQMGFLGNSTKLPDIYSVLLNTAHPLHKKLLLQPADSPERTALGRHIYDLARLPHGLLKGKEMTDFLQRNLELLNQ